RTGLASEITDIHTRQHDLVKAFFTKQSRAANDFVNLRRPRLSSRFWNCAERTRVIATILYFQERAGAFVRFCCSGSVEFDRLRDVVHDNPWAFELLERTEVIKETKLLF